jgi:hypothetical protein
MIRVVMGRRWLLSWQCTSVTYVEHKKYGCCTKARLIFTNDVFVVLCRKLYLAGMGLYVWCGLDLDVDLTVGDGGGQPGSNSREGRSLDVELRS